MVYIVLNALPIGIATLVGAVLGGILYVRLIGRPTVVALVLGLICQFWIACILAGALILAPPEAGRWTMAIGTAVVIWVGFVLPAMVASSAWRGEGFGRMGTDAVHWLLVMVTHVVVLEAMGLVPPPTA